MKFSKLILGFAAGFSAGYLVFRAAETYSRWNDPLVPRTKDAQAYSAMRRALEVTGTLRGICAFVAFAFGPLGARLDRATLWAPVWLRPALYFTATSLLSALVDLPASYVEDYELERSYGLSEQPRSGWLTDYAKGAALSTALSALLATLYGIAVRHSPRRWPVWTSAGTLPLFIVGNIIVPIYIMPLFNRFEPVTGSLEERLRRLATRYGVGDAAILRMDMSRQTRKANAFVTGIGQTHRIVLGDTLIANFPEDETEFVVAHELGHYVNKDTWRLIAIGEVMVIVLFWTASRAVSPRERKMLRKRPLLIARVYATMLLASQLLRPMLFAYSRSREWAADRFALAATADPAAGIAAFKRLRDQNLADEDPPVWYELLFASHPSLRARIERLEGA